MKLLGTVARAPMKDIQRCSPVELITTFAVIQMSVTWHNHNFASFCIVIDAEYFFCLLEARSDCCQVGVTCYGM